jgi:hypothetical protein
VENQPNGYFVPDNRIYDDAPGEEEKLASDQFDRCMSWGIVVVTLSILALMLVLTTGKR